MKIERYVRAILPNFEKRRVLEDLRGLISDLDEVTIPSYKKAMAAFQRGNFRSQAAKKFEGDCKARLSHFKGNHVQTIHRSLKMAHANAEAVSKLVSKTYANDIMRDGITYLVANQLQFIEVTSFASEYARRWLIYLLTVEAGVGGERSYAEKSEILRQEKYLQGNKENFFNALRIISRTPENLAKAFDDVPDVVVDPDKAAITSSVLGSSRVDPMKMGLIPVSLNPIYYVRMAYAEWQTHRYHLLREEAKQLELRLLFMKQSREGSSDAKLEQQIDYSSQRLEKLRFKLNRMEKVDD